MSLENPVGEEEFITSRLYFRSNAITRRSYDWWSLITALNEALETLTDREEKVLRMRYDYLMVETIL